MSNKFLPQCGKGMTLHDRKGRFCGPPLDIQIFKNQNISDIYLFK